MDNSILVVIIFQAITTVLVVLVGMFVIFTYVNLHELTIHLELDYDEDEGAQPVRFLDDGVTPGAQPLNPDGTRRDSVP
jgi:hypothetical protein